MLLEMYNLVTGTHDGIGQQVQGTLHCKAGRKITVLLIIIVFALLFYSPGQDSYESLSTAVYAEKKLPSGSNVTFQPAIL